MQVSAGVCRCLRPEGGSGLTNLQIQITIPCSLYPCINHKPKHLMTTPLRASGHGGGLKQECHTGKIASTIHRLGPKSTQTAANELKNDTHRGWREAAPYCFSIHWQLFVYFLGPACVCCQLFFLRDALASIILPSAWMVKNYSSSSVYEDPGVA